jgi:hypothetical protein
MLRVETDILEEIIKSLSKTVKGDTELLYHILFTGLSAFTKKPNHLIIMEKTSEGKTYPVMEVSKHFPKENVIVLASATPQALKYGHGIQVDENYNPIQDKIDELDQEIETSEKDVKKELQIKRQKLFEDSKTLIDFREKWIIFTEPPSPKFLEVLYSTLSSDQEYSEHQITPDSSGGRKQTFTVVLRGTPSLLICTARDETQARRWEETASRFTIVSPKSSPEKYQQGMELIAKSHGLPKELYEEMVIGIEEQNRLKTLISMLIEQVKSSHGEVFDPFLNELPKLFPKDMGKRMREFQRMQTMIRLHCLCYAQNRTKMVVADRKLPVITLEDVKWALSMIKEKQIIAPQKYQWYEAIFFPCWEKYSIPLVLDDGIKRPCIIGENLKSYADEVLSENHDIKKIRESLVNPLLSYGLIAKKIDPRSQRREVYWPITNEKESSIIAISSIDKDKIVSFVEEIQRRFTFEFNGEIISKEKLVEQIL